MDLDKGVETNCEIEGHDLGGGGERGKNWNTFNRINKNNKKELLRE